jgi:nucleoside-diphosphate-sugar epimerase
MKADVDPSLVLADARRLLERSDPATAGLWPRATALLARQALELALHRLWQHPRASPTIFGDGEQSRDFTSVEDVAELCWKASQAPDVAGKMFNAGNGARYTLNQVWDVLQKMEGLHLPPKFGPPRAGDVRDSMADTTAACQALGHAPRFTLEEGLKRTLEWYRTAE